MKKERRRGRGGGGADDARAAAPPLAEADVDALRFCLDALSDGLDAGGVSPRRRSSRGPRWPPPSSRTSARCPETPGTQTPAKRPSARFFSSAGRARRAPRRVARRACSPRPVPRRTTARTARTEATRDDAVDREDLAEGLRDVAAVVGADVFVAVVVDGAVTAARDAIAAATDANADGNANSTPSTDNSLLRVAEGWIFALFAVARLTTTSPAAAATAARAVDLARGVMDARLSSRASELATWIIAGLARALSSPRSDAETLSSAVAAVSAGLESNDHAVARARASRRCVCARRAAPRSRRTTRARFEPARCSRGGTRRRPAAPPSALEGDRNP